MTVILAANWWSLFVRGLTALVLGALSLLKREMPLSDLVLVFFGYAMLDGILNLAGFVLEILSAVRLRKQVQGEWLLVQSGVASIALGVVMVGMPLAGTSSIALWLGAYALVFGAILVALAFRLRGWVEVCRERRPQPAA